jgi:succinyl-diaminopimelate desuccinylase
MPEFGAKWEEEANDALPRIILIEGGKTPNIVPNRAKAVIEGFSADIVKNLCSEYSEKTNAIISSHAENGRIVLESEGKAEHAAFPELGLNALTALLEMLAAMPFSENKGFGYINALNRLFPHKDYHGASIGLDISDEATGKTTVNFAVLNFSEREFSGSFDSRTSASADEFDIFENTRKKFERDGIVITSHIRKECHHTPEESPFVQTLLKIYEEYTGIAGKCASTGGLSYVHDIRGGVLFGAVMPGVPHNAHGPNEQISVELLLLTAKMLTQAILDICN